MDPPRRRVLLSGSSSLAVLLAAALSLPRTARAQSPYPKALFDAGTIADLARALGSGAPAESRDVTLTAPDIAEDGANVAIGIASALPSVRRLLLLVEKNPNLLAAVADIGDSVDAAFSTRIKMAQTSNVYGVAVLADGRMLYARKEVRVTLGGCGG
ncbi:MAG TPA: thiosulfate oxidation carrier protein SoxY [Caldimonas sp.]|jgi:sulfur-oxidizing protein SoxY|nr:thiosulfate oxidation carrier protein SoxY [Caldimonas sp.]HEX2541742.1 thiosulfate oxidation carrier protein SoxY [Caldimonas sp.]